MAISFDVSPEKSPARAMNVLDASSAARSVLRRRVEALGLPALPLVQCTDAHGLVEAVRHSFFSHFPLTLTPDAVWFTLAQGFATHVNTHAEELRARLVRHEGKRKLTIFRPDFFPGKDNPWPEAFSAFSTQIAAHTGKMRDLIVPEFETTGPIERAASEVLLMDAFQAYFEYEMMCGCGIPSVTLLGSAADWRSVRRRAQTFSEYGLERWCSVVDPVLEKIADSAEGRVDTSFWTSMFHYQGGSGPDTVTGWLVTLFPYLVDVHKRPCPNAFLDDWSGRMARAPTQSWIESAQNPQGPGMSRFPGSLASAPVKVTWGDEASEMRFVAGLFGVTQDPDTLAVAPAFGWAVVYE